MTLIGKVIFLLIKAGKPELCRSIMHYVPTFVVGEDFSNAEQKEKNKFMGVMI